MNKQIPMKIKEDDIRNLEKEIEDTLDNTSKKLALLKNRKQTSVVPKVKISPPEPINIQERL